MKPVFVINGFLESGKTEFIKFTMQQEYFQTKGKTLILLCEEGEVEYEPELLAKHNTVVEVIEKKEDFIGSKLIEIEKKHKPERIIVEDNGRGVDPSGASEPGIALENIRQRLEMMCGGSMTIRSREGGGTVVTITIPDSTAQSET